MNALITLTPIDLALAATLIGLLALTGWRMGLGISSDLLIAAARNVIQLLLVGLVLNYLFDSLNFWLIFGVTLIMLAAAGWEVRARQARRLRGWRGYGYGAISMFVSAFTVTLFGLFVVIGPTPWWQPQYLIPLLGMLLGNTMTGVAVGLDRLHEDVYRHRQLIEQRLMLGETAREALSDIRRAAARAGMIPIINAMAAAGIVSLPGMMTGQILAGAAPVEAVKYQIVIFFLVTAGTGGGVLVGLQLSAKRLFDGRERLKLGVLTNID